MRIAIISDTHMPRGERAVPAECADAMRGSDLIIHAGDLSEASVLEWTRSLGPAVVAVHGNVDSPELRDELPESTVVEAGGVRIGVIHDAGRAAGRLGRMRARFPDVAAVVFGHSHIPLHEEAGGFQIFNPGSPTERRRSPRHSFGIAEAHGGSVSFRHRWIG